jgi:hypothetical protein
MKASGAPAPVVPPVTTPEPARCADLHARQDAAIMSQRPASHMSGPKTSQSMLASGSPRAKSS